MCSVIIEWHILLIYRSPTPTHNKLHQSGVDISRTRLTVCRQVLVKYQIGRPSPSSPAALPVGEEKGLVASSSLVFPSSWYRLLCADGCSFTTGPGEAWKGPVEDVVFDSRAYDWKVRTHDK